MGERDLVHHLVKEAADRQIPSTAVADTELARLRAVEAAARAVVDHEFVSEHEWSGGLKAHKAKSLELLTTLKAALGSLREGG